MDDNVVRTARRLVAAPLLVLLAALLVLLAGAGAPAAAAPGDVVKVFVVADPGRTGGTPATLTSIAADTLGDPGRAGEILALNRGRPQPDGAALNGPDDALHPGWILRLPADASGAGVTLARETADGGDGARPGPAVPAPVAAPVAGPATLSVPLPAVLAVLGSLLLALVTVAIVARRQVGSLSSSIGRGLAAVGAPARRRRRLAQRRAVAAWFDADLDAVRRAYDTIGEVAAAGLTAPAEVHALSVDGTGATVWLPPADTLAPPWQSAGPTRWHRPSSPASWRNQATGAQIRRAQAEEDTACLVRAGTDSTGQAVFVDLSRLDGVLEVGGDPATAREVIHHLLTEIARVRPGTPVVSLAAGGGAAPIVPAGLHPVTQPPLSVAGDSRPVRAAIRGAAGRRPVRGVVVVSGRPDERTTAEVLRLCGTTGAGWTGLACDPVPAGVHWRWTAGPDGTIDIPLLPVALTAPA